MYRYLKATFKNKKIGPKAKQLRVAPFYTCTKYPTTTFAWEMVKAVDFF
jgi:hypothetical protein